MQSRSRVVGAVLLCLLVAGVAHGVAAQAQTQTPTPSCNLYLSGAASLLIPGWGQLLDGQPDQARVNFAVTLLNAALAAIFWNIYGPVAIPAHLIWASYSGITALVTCWSLVDP